MRNRSQVGWRITVAFFVSFTATSELAAQCGFKHAFDRPDENGSTTVKVFRGDPVPALSNTRPLLYIVPFKVNTDGTEISYSESDPTGLNCQRDPAANHCAINNIRNAFRNHLRPVTDFTVVRDAGYPNPRTWQVLSPKIIEMNAATKKPCIVDGYLVSMTADVAVDGGFARVGDCDQSKWIEALTIPAIVLPQNSQFAGLKATKRTLVVALSRSETKRTVFGIVGDLGPPKEIGEASVAMNRALNGLADDDRPKHRQDAKDRFQTGRTAVLLFPGREFVVSRPISKDRIDTSGNDALMKFGGADRLYECIRTEIDPAF